MGGELRRIDASTGRAAGNARKFCGEIDSEYKKLGDSMKIVFVSNYFNHHQKPLCEELYSILGDDFYFISTGKMRTERIVLGYHTEYIPRYVFFAYETEQNHQKALEMIDRADAVIAGAVPESYLSDRLRQRKLVLRYAERPFKKEPSFLRRLYNRIRFRWRDKGNQNVYMLCASAYAAADFASVGMYKNRMYRWGYFPDAKKYNTEELLAGKKRRTMLWCGRFIDWKHPDDAIRVAGALKERGCEFQLNMIGTGDMEEELKCLAEACDVADRVHFLGAMSPEQVRVHMEEAGIYLFTSDRQEGWGAVLNEAMASGCAVVASDAAGATPFLIRNGENGFVYQSGNIDMLVEKVQLLLCHETAQAQYGQMAYRTIMDTWNAGIASERLIRLVERILPEDKDVCLFAEGPCSSADIK